VGHDEAVVKVEVAAKPRRGEVVSGRSPGHRAEMSWRQRGVDVGLSRELRVAEGVGGRVAKVGERKDLKLRSPSGEGVTIDVLGPEGELIVVGGPSKARSPGALGDRLRVLKETADAQGVKAQAFFEEGTPQSVLDIAATHLGAANVRIFPR
jgi:filamentous hemagglutinin